MWARGWSVGALSSEPSAEPPERIRQPKPLEDVLRRPPGEPRARQRQRLVEREHLATRDAAARAPGIDLALVGEEQDRGAGEGEALGPARRGHREVHADVGR